MKFQNGLFTSALVMLIATLAPAQVLNGSFEADPDNAAPSNWLGTGGWSYVTSVPDDMFPTDGTKYLVVDVTDGIGPTFATYGPHCWNCGGQVRQVVTRPPGEFCSLSLDWDFLSPEDAYPGFYNDFLSVDVVDALTDTLIANVVFVDTGTTAGTPPYTNVPGAAGGVLTWVPGQSTGATFTTALLAPVGPKRASVDLSAVPVGTVMLIEIFVGNVGDSYIPSRAYIDRIVLSGGQQNLNAGTAALRVLGSAHSDGLSGGPDWSEPALPMAPYHFRTSAGQRLSFRATGVAGLHFWMVAGSLLDPGAPTPFGQVNVNLANPFLFLIDSAVLTGSTNWYDLFIPETVPNGIQLTVQGVMEQVGGTLALSAATTIEIGAPQIPEGSVDVVGGAATDDGSTNEPFAAFGGGTWPFFGVPRSSVDVNSNGSLTFGAGDSTATETESGMLTGPARIAAIWDDLFPPDFGNVRTTQTAKTYTASWTHVRESPAGPRGNNFSIQLYQQNTQSLTPGGVFTIYFGSTTMDDGLTGISPGGLPAPAPNTVSSNVDWTSLAASIGARGVIPAGSAKFEKFATADNGSLRDTLDLMSLSGVKSITFVPDGAGGYTYFVGSR